MKKDEQLKRAINALRVISDPGNTFPREYAAEALAAQHLAGQDYLVALERKRVAREIADFIKNHRIKWTEGMQTDQIERDIRAKYGVDE